MLEGRHRVRITCNFTKAMCLFKPRAPARGVRAIFMADFISFDFHLGDDLTSVAFGKLFTNQTSPATGIVLG